MKRGVLYGAALACVFLAGCTEKPAGETETIMLPGDVPLVMVWMPKGSFLMGSPDTELARDASEGPQHTVTLSSGFWMGKYELTQAQWQAVMGTTPWSVHNYVLADLDSPAMWVSWDDAKLFVAALNSLTGKTFRLPSESEWEYACRAGTTTRFYWGDDPTDVSINDYAWWDGNAGSIGEKYAHVVGQKLPNEWGLYDMSGNAWEWCEDDWHYDYVNAPTEGQAWVDSPRSIYRVNRGGYWYSPGPYCRSAARSYDEPSTAGFHVGFRLAR